MSNAPANALVFFGATGDLAYKKIFPSLLAMVKRGHLDVPVIGVAKAGYTLERLKARARESVEQHGGHDPAAFERLCGLLRYVDGDYADPATFRAIREQLGTAQRPAHYLAIPPSMFEIVVEQLGKSGCAANARVIIEKPSATISPHRGNSMESCSRPLTRRRFSGWTTTWESARSTTWSSSDLRMPSSSRCGTESCGQHPDNDGREIRSSRPRGVL